MDNPPAFQTFYPGARSRLGALELPAVDPEEADRHLAPRQGRSTKGQFRHRQGRRTSTPIPPCRRTFPVHDPLVAIPLTARRRSRLRCYPGSHGHLRLDGCAEGDGRRHSSLWRLAVQNILCRLSAFTGRLMALERKRVRFLVKKPDCAPGASYSLGGASCDALCRRPHPGERGYTVTNVIPRAVRENRAIWINPTLTLS